ncbi:GNAT family N-acetyltransferase [Pyramidobacter porci]
MKRLKLVRPDAAHEAQVMACRRVFLERRENFAGCAGLEDVESYAEWLDFEKRLSKKYGDGYVPSTVLLAVRTEDETLAGILEIRHRLTPFLLRYGGHIGYSVLPSQRRQGCATEMLLRLPLIPAPPLPRSGAKAAPQRCSASPCRSAGS